MIWSVKHSWKACDSVLDKQHSSQKCALGLLQGEKVKCRIKGPFARRAHDVQVPASGDRPANVFLVVDLVGYTDLNIFDDQLLE